MTIQRKNPFDNAVAPATREAVTAGNVDAISTYREGLCPECQRPMILTDTAGIPSYVCLDHRINLPLRKQQ